MRILAVDPGTHTGWAYVDTEEGVQASFEGGELGPYPATPEGDLSAAEDVMNVGLMHFVDRYVIEDFILLPASVKGGMNSNREGLSSVRVGSSLYTMLRMADEGVGLDQIFWQQPSVMTVIDSGRLKRAGMWVVGSEHARDAAKHLLIHLRKEVRRWAD